MASRLSPRKSAEFIAGRSKNVFVNMAKMQDASEKICKSMNECCYSKQSWKEHELHPKEMDEKTLDWIFVIDCLNFSFWQPRTEPAFKVNYKDKDYTDYEALCATINRALDEGIQLTTPSYYKDITLEQIKHIFRSSSSSELPLLSKRVEHLQEAGKILYEKYGNSVSNLIKKCNNSAQELIQKIVNEFPSFRDESTYEGQAVSFYKRAQIFVADVWACFEGENYGRFDDIKTLTMFADYRVPQALLFLGILEYSEDLSEKIKKEIEIEAFSKEEMEIRGCSIHAVECLRSSIERNIESGQDGVKINELNSVIIDFYLWDFATFNADKVQEYPEHRTRGHFY
eukprot:gene6089-6792_t